MLDTFSTNHIIAIFAVVLSIVLLIYFAVKTLITSNLFQKGINLYQAKDYPGAEAAFRQVISMNSTNDVVRLLLGDVLNQQGKIEAAGELFAELIRRSPKNADAYLRLANVMMQQNQPEVATKNLLKAKELLQKQRQPQKVEQIDYLLGKIESST